MIPQIDSIDAKSLRKPATSKSRFGLFCSIVAAVAWTYAGVVAVVLAGMHLPSAQLDWIAEWSALPTQGAALLLLACYSVRRGLRTSPARLVWWCVLAFATLNPIAAYVWNTLRPASAKALFTFADGLYLADYWLLTAAFALLFVRVGGTFRSSRIWLDAATMTAVQLVGVWSFFLGPSLDNGTGAGISAANTLAYSLTLTGTMTMAALYCLQLPTFRGRTPELLLVCAGAATVIWELVWMASWLADRDLVGRFYNFGDMLCFAAVSSSVAAAQCSAPAAGGAASPQRQADSFLPALAVLVAIALVAGSIASTRRWDAWLLVGLVGLCSLLLITRQTTVRQELRALNRQLAKQDADARLTELVRRSADLIMVIDAEWMVTFASPATESMLGQSVAQVQGTRAVDMFGADRTPLMTDFLGRVQLPSAAPCSIELRAHGTNEHPCLIKLSAVNQLDNELIHGIVLTLTDVTEQRLLEREVLDVAARERARLSADIHDGLGQELVGVSLLLKGVATMRDLDTAAHRLQLQIIVDHVNRSIVTARDLARGLSPLHVVRGSLSGALRRLVPEASSAIAVHLRVDPEFDERVLDDFSADHLYRIAHEAVTNATRHSGCSRIDITLRRLGSTIVLGVKDDGHGFRVRAPDYPGLGLRLMEYRARIVGGTLRLEHSAESGSQIEVSMPVGAVSARPPR